MHLCKSLEAVSSSYLFEMECINVIIQLRVHCYFCNYFLYMYVILDVERECFLVYNARTQERFANRLCASCCCLQRAVSSTFSPLHDDAFSQCTYLQVCPDRSLHENSCTNARPVGTQHLNCRVLPQTMSRSVSDVRQHIVVLYIISGSMQRDFAVDTASLSKLISRKSRRLCVVPENKRRIRQSTFTTFSFRVTQWKIGQTVAFKFVL